MFQTCSRNELKPPMTTISEKADLRPSHLADFLKAARPGHKGSHYITDLKCTGLSLRLKGEKVAFFLRYKGISRLNA